MKHRCVVTLFLTIIASIVISGSLSPTAGAQTEDSFTYLPVVAKPLNPPVLNPISNDDWDNFYTVSWDPLAVDYYVLEESQSAAFSESTVVYQGTASTWSVPTPGKYPGEYYYRVRAYSQGKSSSWSKVQSIAIKPLYVGLDLRWDGTGYLNVGQYYEPGWHMTMNLDAVTSPGVVRARHHLWYNPDPLNFGESYYDSFYSLATGRFLSSSGTQNPAWKWENPLIVPYDINFYDGQTISVDGQPFLVSGPHSGYTSFGQPVQYWELTNRDRFLFYDDGGEWTQYVHAGEAKLRYDAGATRLLIYRNVLRRYYQNGNTSNYTVRYVFNLTGADSFPGGSISTDSATNGPPVIDRDQPASPLLPEPGYGPFGIRYRGQTMRSDEWRP